jgi:proteasome lid subunit RPN8/RPN11
VIELNDWLREELRRRALAERPNECCGLIALKDGKMSLYGAENAAESPSDSFLIAPRDQIAILKQIEVSGQTLAGIYHSHPRGPAEPSARDREIARSWPGLTWVIIGCTECPNCTGGYIADIEPECCGNTTSSGECRGDCAVPREVERPCPTCGGDGVVPGFDFFAGLL